MQYEDLPGDLATRIEVAYADAVDELRERLARLERFPVLEPKIKHAEAAVVASLAAGIYSAGCAILALYRADLGIQIPGLVRSQFEAAVKIQSVRNDPQIAVDFIDSEPFERWFLTDDHPVRKELMDGIKSDALLVLRARQELLQWEQDPSAVLAGKIDPKYHKIRNHLKFKSIDELVKALRKTDPSWSANLYTLIFRIGSLPIHNAILFVRNAFGATGDDGSARFSLSQHYDGAPDYLVQSANYLIGASALVGHTFGHDAASGENLKTLRLREQALATELADLDRVASEQR